MKVYLDDVRDTPAGWVRAYWPDEVVPLLATGKVTHLSLDHDLGNDERGTGHDVLVAIEAMIHDGQLAQLPEITNHSANSSAKQRMDMAVKAIQRQWAARPNAENHRRKERSEPIGG
jgi:hypothetical protein